MVTGIYDKNSPYSVPNASKGKRPQDSSRFFIGGKTYSSTKVCGECGSNIRMKSTEECYVCNKDMETSRRNRSQDRNMDSNNVIRRRMAEDIRDRLKLDNFSSDYWDELEGL